MAEQGNLFPLSYVGVRSNNPPKLWFEKRDPTTSDYKNYIIGDEWWNSMTQDWWKLTQIYGTTATWVLLAGGSGNVETITTPDSTVVSPVLGNFNFLNGSGMNITGSGNNITFNAFGEGLTWSVVTTPQTLGINNGYLANNGAGVAFTLPLVCSVGDVFGVAAMNAGGWTIAQGPSQSIILGEDTTTVGAGGSLASTKIGDVVMFVCCVANLQFFCLSSIGNITVV